MVLAVGSSAPAFTVKDTNGNTVSLSDFAGKTVVLYFYPKDDTPGCTK
ncbi:MAG: redoxin domain-containing protein, partial [Cyanobacteria bacterium]|nr:redoxin domain-containing protein [Cyanobacteriota bacterium]MDW8201202.1 redoxin domain-containing protein [Cyanobacteriota bacterium SKYGB_h_bin112]